MNVTLPDGTTVEGVPEGTTKDQLAQKLKSSGREVPSDWFKPKKTPIQQLEELEPSTATAPKPRSMLAKGMETLGNVWEASKLEGLAPEGPSIVRAAPKALEALEKGVTAGREAATGLREALPSLSKELTPELAQKQSVLQRAVKEGYVVPPKDAPKSGIISQTAGGLSGKIKTEQAASRVNAEVTQRLLKADIGIPQDKVLNEGTLDAVRKEAGKAYDSVKRIGTPFKADEKFNKDIMGIRRVSATFEEQFPNIGKNPEIEKIVSDLRKDQLDPEHAIELTKVLRHDAAKNLLSEDPKVSSLGEAQKRAARAVEDLVERNLTASGKKDLLDNFRAARTKIAKTYDIQSTLRPDGYADVRKLAKKSGKLTGSLKTAVDFASQFEKSTQPVGRLGGEENLGVLDVMLGIGGAVAHPALAGAVLARPLARKAVLSGPVQRSLADLPILEK